MAFEVYYQNRQYNEDIYCESFNIIDEEMLHDVESHNNIV